MGGDMAVKLERKERKGPSGLVEDLEEDKRE